jgi:hypothetical protein
VAVGVDGARPDLEELEPLFWKGLERRPVHFQEVGVDLFAGRAMDAQPGYRAVPLPQERRLLFQAVEAPPLEGVALDVPSAPLLDALFLGVVRPRRQGDEPPVPLITPLPGRERVSVKRVEEVTDARLLPQLTPLPGRGM